MRPRVVVDPDKLEAEADEIKRLALAARKQMHFAWRCAGGPHGFKYERWKEAREQLEALAGAEVPDVIAARRAFWYGRVGPIRDEQASAEWEGYRP